MLLKFKRFITSPFQIFILFVIILFSYFFIDRQLSAYISQHRSSWTVYVSSEVTFIGDGMFWLILLPILFLIAFLRKKQLMMARICFISASLIIASVPVHLLKFIFGRSRSHLFLDQEIYEFHPFNWSLSADYSSFPSGHTATIAGAMIASALFWPKYRYFFYVILLMVATTRIILFAHLFGDCLFGAYIGAVITCLLLKYFDRIAGNETYG